MLTVADEILVRFYSQCTYLKFNEDSTEVAMAQILLDLAEGKAVRNIRIRYFGPYPGSLLVIYDTDNGSVDEVVGEEVCATLALRADVDKVQYERYLLEKEDEKNKVLGKISRTRNDAQKPSDGREPK